MSLDSVIPVRAAAYLVQLLQECWPFGCYYISLGCVENPEITNPSGSLHSKQLYFQDGELKWNCEVDFQK